MIVKFIAVICLLLFIPKLEIIKKKVSNKDDEDSEERSLSSRKFLLWDKSRTPWTLDFNYNKSFRVEWSFLNENVWYNSKLLSH